MKFFMKGILSKNNVCSFLTRHAHTYMLSTAGNIMHKYNLNYNFICRSTYNAVAKIIQDTYDNGIRNDDHRIHASVITDCIAIRDNSAQYASLSYEEASDIIKHLALI